jgi:micrococcal nuclease
VQKFLSGLPALAVIGVIWFQFFYKSNSDKPKLAKRPSETQSLRCQVMPGSVRDGDTFQVRCDGDTFQIRLCGIELPDVKRPLGIESRNYLRSLLVDEAKGQVIVVEMDRNKYGRISEVLFETPQGEKSVQEEILMAGMAYHHKASSTQCLNGDAFDTAQQVAKAQKRGVWGLPVDSLKKSNF